MKRTSLNIEEGIFNEIRQLAVKGRMSQTALLQLLLSDGIKRFKERLSASSNQATLPVAGRGGLIAGIDLSERARVWDLLDEGREKLS